MAFSFKLPKRTEQEGAPSAGGGIALPAFLSGQSVLQQMKTLGGIFVVLLLLIASLVFYDNRESAYGTAYISAAGEMRMLSQRLAKASTLAIQGNPSAFAHPAGALSAALIMSDLMRR